VACALTVPVGARRLGGESMVTQFMDALHPWVAYGVLPLFAFTAAGIPLRALTAHEVLSPVTVGVAVALLVGKPIGVFGVTALAAVLKLGRRPTGSTWLELLGVAVLTGVGFTMSFYLGGLAFGHDAALAQTQVRLGVIAGSLASAIAGAALLWLARSGRAAADSPPGL
jgi:NhaA family Na+:H+ antiporter